MTPSTPPTTEASSRCLPKPGPTSSSPRAPSPASTSTTPPLSSQATTTECPKSKLDKKAKFRSKSLSASQKSTRKCCAYPLTPRLSPKPGANRGNDRSPHFLKRKTPCENNANRQTSASSTDNKSIFPQFLTSKTGSYKTNRAGFR